MALTMTITTTDGITISNAYGKITNFNGDKHQFSFTINFYISKEAAEEGIAPLRTGNNSHSFSYDLIDSRNLYEQAYDYLKTLDFFKNAIDVMDNYVI
ncbi:hypothetical protein [Terribacillus sp. AE2B 122]|uniref:hypothetical protein n=1 Tax=Terribacillus sp. AE2B 122 TaxID=1331902 RepID=UPI001583A66B|nr:hypothetical protein [Terribacillus sp. AE2B 122]